MRWLTLGLLTAVVLTPASQAAENCNPTAWVESAAIFRDEPINNETEGYVVEITPTVTEGKTYFDEPSHVAQFSRGSGILVRAQLDGGEGVEVIPKTVRLAGELDLVQVRFDAEALQRAGGKVVNLDVIIPPDRLFCGDALYALESSVKVTKIEGDVKIAEFVGGANQPAISNLEIGTAGDDEEGRGSLGIDFDFEKHLPLGYSRVTAGQWRELTGAVEVGGSFSTREGTYFDHVVGKVSGAYRSTDIEGTQRLVRSWIVKIDAGPESTADGDDRDYVYALRSQAIVGLRLPTANRSFFQPYPLFGLAVERVDPSKREDGSAPENFTRAVASVDWTIYLSGTTALELDGEVRRRLDSTADRWSRRWDVSLSLMRENAWQPFLKYSRGEEPPRFEFHEEALAGIRFVDLVGLLTGRARD